MQNYSNCQDIYRFTIQTPRGVKTSVSMDGLLARQLIVRLGSLANTTNWVSSVAKKYLIEKDAGLHVNSPEFGVSRYVQRVALGRLLNISEFAIQNTVG